MGIWIILIGVPLILGIWAQMKVSGAYRRNAKIPTRSRISGSGSSPLRDAERGNQRR